MDELSASDTQTRIVPGAAFGGHTVRVRFVAPLAAPRATFATMRRSLFAAGVAAAGLFALVARRTRHHVPPPGAPVPPELPPGRTVTLPARGEVFLRDTGPSPGPTFLLVHGWSVSADVNWSGVYGPLATRGRVLAPDLRGHGRSIRAGAEFRLRDAADDLVAVLDALEVERAVVIGYSMGGPVAELFARDHTDRVQALVLCATFGRFVMTRRDARLHRLLPLARFILRRLRYRTLVRLLRSVTPERMTPEWLAGELMRWDVDAVAAAGREILKFDATAWLPSLSMPRAVVVTTRDGLVSVAKQRRLVEALHAPSVDVPLDHDGVVTRPEEFVAALCQALDLTAPQPA